MTRRTTPEPHTGLQGEGGHWPAIKGEKTPGGAGAAVWTFIQTRSQVGRGSFSTVAAGCFGSGRGTPSCFERQALPADPWRCRTVSQKGAFDRVRRSGDVSSARQGIVEMRAGLGDPSPGTRRALIVFQFRRPANEGVRRRPSTSLLGFRAIQISCNDRFGFRLLASSAVYSGCLGGLVHPASLLPRVGPAQIRRPPSRKPKRGPSATAKFRARMAQTLGSSKRTEARADSCALLACGRR